MDGLTFNNNKLTVSKTYAEDKNVAEIVLSTYTTKVTLVSAASYNKDMKIDADNLDAELISVHSGSGNDTLISRSTTDTKAVLNADKGNDSLKGGTGNDTLVGGAGDDTLIANAGNNSLKGDAGTDYIFTGVGGSDTVKAGAGTDFIFTGNVTSSDSLSYVDISGEAGADTFFINPGAQVFIRDYAANELISLASGLSVIDTETAIVGSDVRLQLKNTSDRSLDSYITIKGGKTKNINIDGVSSIMTNSWEQLITASYIKDGEITDNEALTKVITAKNDAVKYINASKITAPVTIKGGGSIETITSGDGDDSINVDEANADVLVKVNGGKGNDILIGSSSSGDKITSSASLNGGAGDDTLFAGKFTDTTMTGGKGNDFFVTFKETDSNDELKGNLVISDYTVNEDVIKTNLATRIVSYEISDNKKDVILHLDDSVSGSTVTIKNKVGKKINIVEDADTVAQYFGTSSISLVNADDSIFSGNDYFNSDITKISASGRSTAIEIYGNNNDNVITGGKGNDTIHGATGKNTLSGGAGADTFVIEAGTSDVIKDFAAGVDTIRVYGTIVDGEKVEITKDKSLTFKYTNGSSSTYTTFTLLKAAVGKKINIIEVSSNGTEKDVSKYYGAKPAQLYNTDSDSYDMNNYNDADLLRNAAAISAANRTNPIEIIGNENTTSIVGGKGDDSLTGYEFTDENAVTMRGGAGNDIVTGKSGHDALFGDAGNDTIYASSISSDVLNNIETANSMIESAAHQIKNYNILSGGAGTDVLVGSTTDDSLDGGAGNDSLVSNGGYDTLNGGAGNDTLIGSNSTDILIGGAGNDVIYAKEHDDSVDAGAGNDTIYAGTENTTITTGAGKDTIIYEGGNVIITDYSAGNDSIYLGTKTISNYTYEYDSDTKKGDLILTTSDNRTITVKNAATKLMLNEDGTTIDSITAATKVKLQYDNTGADSDTNPITSTSMTYGLQKLAVANADVAAEGTLNVNSFTKEKNDKFTINYIDASKRSKAYTINLEGDSTNTNELTLVGGVGNDTVNGGGGNNYLDGGKGDDYIIGKGNTNTLVGGKGNDTLTGITGKADTFVYTTGDGNDTITNYESDHDIIKLGSKATTINYAASSVSGDDVILKIGSGTINLQGALDKVLSYSEYNSSDTTLFKVTSQTVSIKGADSEADTIYAHTATNGTEVTVSNKDAIFIGTAGADNIVVNSGSSTDTYIVDSGAGNDTLQGGIGIDSLFGNAGDDTLIGGSGNDYIDGGAGNDIIYGDELDYTITSSGGNDEINGGAGNDTVYGGAGADIIYGDAGNDSLYGNAGNDTLDGGKGNDTLTGGDGSDIFVFTNGGGKDVITDYAAGDMVSLGNAFSAMITGSRDSKDNYVLKSGSNTLTFVDADESLTITVKNGDSTSTFVTPAKNNTTNAYIASDLFNDYVAHSAVDEIMPVTDFNYSIGKLDTATNTDFKDLTKIVYAKNKE